MTASLKIQSSKPVQTLWRASQEVNWNWSQCIKSHHAQTSSGKGLPSHFWNRNIIRSILLGLRRGTEYMLLEVQCEISTVSDDLGSYVICWCWSTVFSEVHSQRSHLPGNFRVLNASFCWQALWRCWFHFLAGLGTFPQTRLTWTLLRIYGYYQEEDERHQTQQYRWPEGRYQSNLGFHYTRALPQSDHLHATPHWCSNSCKRRPNQVLSA